MTNSSNGSGNHPQQSVFKNSPNRFQKARGKASQLTDHLIKLNQAGPRTMVATVVDTDFHLTKGYVGCQTQLGYVHVVGIPMGSVVPNMRVMVRQMGGMATNRAYVFDGYAPALSTLGDDSGSLQSLTNLNGDEVPLPYAQTVAAVSASASNLLISGYYWHLWFYVPVLPAIETVLFQMVRQDIIAPKLYLSYLPTGQLKFYSDDGHGYLSNSTSPVSAHNAHWLVIQPGLSYGSEMYIDGAPLAYTPLTGIVGDDPTWTGGGTATYKIYFLSNDAGNMGMPIGTWISKFGWGVGGTQGIPAQLPVAVPQQDSDLVGWNGTMLDPTSGNSATNYTAVILYLMTDTTTLTSYNNAVNNGSPTIFLNDTTIANLIDQGPY